MIYHRKSRNRHGKRQLELFKWKADSLAASPTRLKPTVNKWVSTVFHGIYSLGAEYVPTQSSILLKVKFTLGMWTFFVGGSRWSQNFCVRSFITRRLP